MAKTFLIYYGEAVGTTSQPYITVFTMDFKKEEQESRQRGKCLPINKYITKNGIEGVKNVGPSFSVSQLSELGARNNFHDKATNVVRSKVVTFYVVSMSLFFSPNIFLFAM